MHSLLLFLTFLGGLGDYQHAHDAVSQKRMTNRLLQCWMLILNWQKFCSVISGSGKLTLRADIHPPAV